MTWTQQGQRSSSSRFKMCRLSSIVSKQPADQERSNMRRVVFSERSVRGKLRPRQHSTLEWLQGRRNQQMDMSC